jgi:hypothetical protein
VHAVPRRAELPQSESKRQRAGIRAWKRDRSDLGTVPARPGSLQVPGAARVGVFGADDSRTVERYPVMTRHRQTDATFRTTPAPFRGDEESAAMPAIPAPLMFF